MKTGIVLLGSSGSIGRSTLDVVRAFPDRFRIEALAVESDVATALRQARRFGARHVAVADPDRARYCSQRAWRGLRVHSGPEGVAELAALAGADVVVCAVVGMAGLRPVMSAIRAGTDVALATKEVLVAAGGLVTAAARKRGVRILPVDSEHSAVLQCLDGAPRAGRSRDLRSPARWNPDSIRRIVLTASGGPFGARPEADFRKVTVREALRHPRWNMGRKISVDSATLMNKGLEVMEARWLFDIPLDRIDVLVHPESIVHSMVEFADGAVLAQLGVPDMRFAILYALAYPERMKAGFPRLDLAELGSLTFREPDEDRFPCLRLARKAAALGGTMPAVLNASNEVAVEAFLSGNIVFADIWALTETVMSAHRRLVEPDLDDIVDADRWAREQAMFRIGRMCRGRGAGIRMRKSRT